jgi:hypothetical protein
MQKKWKYGILGYAFLMFGLAIGLYLGKLILDISNELFRAYIAGTEVSPDDLFRYAWELDWVYLCGIFALTFIPVTVLFLFFNALLEEERIGDRGGDEKIEPYYYEVLGISKEASLEEVKNAYREASLQFHTDVIKKKDAKEKFIMIRKGVNVI